MRHAGSEDRAHSLLPRGLILLALGVLYFGLLHHLYLSSEQERQARLGYQLTSLGQNLEDVIHSRLYLLAELDSYVHSEPDLSQERFEQITQEIFLRQPGIRSLQLARNSTISHISPLAGNREALGHNLVDDHRRYIAAQQAIDQRQAVLAGPLDLIQGGQGLAVRQPIYIYPGPDQPEQYWGLAIILLDWQQVLKESDLPGVTTEYEIALRQQDSEGVWQPAFYGEDRLFSLSDSEEILIQLPSTSWQLALRSKLSSSFQFRLIGYALGLLLLLFSTYYLLRLSHSHHALAPSAFALCFILLALLVIGFDALDRHSAQQITLAQTLSEQNNRIRARLLGQLQFLQNLAARTSQAPMSPAEFQQKAQRHLKAFPELTQLTWLNQERRILQQASREPGPDHRGKKLAILESQKAAQKAQSHHQPVFTAAFVDEQQRYRFDLWLPVYRGHQFLGLVGTRFDTQQLLEQGTSSELRRLYRLRLRNRGELEYASLLRPGQELSDLRAMITLSPPGQGMALELTRYSDRWSLLSLLLLGLLLTMGGLTVLNLQRLLKQHQRLERDLNQERQHRTELEQSHNLLRTTLHSIGEGVITTDANGLVYRINPVAEALCQCAQREAEGQPLFSVLRLQDTSYAKPLRQRLNDALTAAREQREVQWLTGTLVDQATELHSVRCTIAPIITGDGEFLGNVIIINDLSSMQAMARRLEYRDRNEQHAPLGSDEFELCCKEALIHARETGYQHLLLYVDLDLSALGNRPELLTHIEMPLFHLLKKQVRLQDPLAQLGRHRFAVLLRYCSMQKGQEIATKMLKANDEPGIIWTGPGERPSLHLNIGLACISEQTADYSTLTTQADMACYIAHSLGPNRLYQSTDSCMESAIEPAPSALNQDQASPGR